MTVGDNMEKLLEIMRALRDPRDGCPWDLEQDFKSIAAWTLEETYEVLEAINLEDMQALRDELGDLLFQVVYHAQMADEAGEFDFNDVVAGITGKLLRRHPHVFGDETVSSASEQSRRWHHIKTAEQGNSAERSSSGMLDDVAVSQPAMRRAEKLQQKAATVGFDWDDPQPVFAKVREELAELQKEVEEGAAEYRLLDESGDLLFAMINLMRKLGINPELALGRANNKFIRRFGYIENELEKSGTTLDEAKLELMDRLWDAAKQQE